jgi:deazaflavin-dependent oxidoreductase (nitroreductase family)
MDLDSRPSLFAKFARRIGHHRWFSWTMKHVGSKLDRVLYRASAGRLWLSGPEMPTMLLTTKGRKTGKRRTVPVYYVHDGENLVAACENFGLQHASCWPINALAHPQVEAQIGACVQGYRARLATAEETARNMPLLLDMWPAHNTYLERSGQRYVFVFEPSGRPSD